MNDKNNDGLTRVETNSILSVRVWLFAIHYSSLPTTYRTVTMESYEKKMKHPTYVM